MSWCKKRGQNPNRAEREQHKAAITAEQKAALEEAKVARAAVVDGRGLERVNAEFEATKAEATKVQGTHCHT